MIAFHFKLTTLGVILVAVGVFIRVGGPSVSTAKLGEYAPKSTLFLARTRKFTFIFGGNVWLLAGTNENEVTRPSTSNSVNSTHVLLP